MKRMYEETFGEFGFKPNEGAPYIYQQGWNDALAEAARRVNELPFGSDTKASFSVFFIQMMETMNGHTGTDKQEDQ